jgi:hypothetical protein
MDTVLRVLVIAALIVWSIFRLVRYFRYGMAKRVTAVPPSAGILLPNTGVPVGSDSPARSASRSVRFIAGLIVVIVWAAANAVLWFILFRLPMLAKVPFIWRLFVGVFANFYLFPFARGLGRQAEQMQARSGEVDNPFKT